MSSKHTYRAWLLCALLSVTFLVFSSTFPVRRQTKAATCSVPGGTVQIALRRHKLTATQGGTEIFVSNADWKVEDFLLCDIDANGTTELLALVWKRGSFGEHKPFWIAQDGICYSQHIFIYRFCASNLQPIWMSSRLQPMVKSWESLRPGALRILTRKGEDTIWGWRSWGLERLDGKYIAF
ncbi:MAG: hypothetical protein RSF90_06980 [Pygmaiobacter sp.]